MSSVNKSTDVSQVLLGEARTDLYQSNAFRLAELWVEATTKEISQRQATIKNASSIEVAVPPGRGRALPLKELPDSATISAAAQRLSDPQKRLIEELFWFWPEKPGRCQQDEALGALARGNAQAARNIWLQQERTTPPTQSAVHNMAVLAHSSALAWELAAESRSLTEAEEKDRDLWWQGAFERWKWLIGSEDFWDRIRFRIRDLDDPRLPTETIQQLRSSLALMLLLINARLAVRAAEQNKTTQTQRQLQLMRSSGLPTSSVDEALRQVADPTRERVKALCKNAETQTDSDKQKADEVAKRLLEQAKAPLGVLDALLPKGHAMAVGAHDEVALTALSCVVAYGNKTEQWKVVIPLLEQILLVAVGEAARARIKENLQAAKNNQTLSLCWYCQERAPVEQSAAVVMMHKVTARVPTYRGTRVQYQQRTIRVPRCSECSRIAPKKSSSGGNAGGWAFFLGLISCFAVSVLANNVGAGIGAFIVVGLIVGIIISAASSSQREKPPAIRQVHDTNSFPPIQELRKDGWQFGAEPLR